MAQERIDSIIDIPAVKKEFDQVLEMLDKLGMSIKESNNPSGAGSMAQSLTERKNAMKDLQAQTEKMINADKQLETQMDAVVSAAKEAANVNKQAVSNIKAYNGTLDENIKLQVLYKAQLADVKARQKMLEAEFKASEHSIQDYQAAMVQLVKEEKELKQANTELNVIVRSQVREMNAAGNSLNELRAQLIQLKNAADNMDIGSAEFIEAQRQAADLNDKIKKLEFSRGDFQRNVGNYAGTFSSAFDVLKTQLGEVQNKLAEMRTQGNEGSPAFQSLVKEEEQLYKLTNKLSTEFTGTKQEVRELQKAATELALAWGQNNETVRKFIAEVGEAKDSVGDVSDAIKLAASDTKGLDNLINAAQGIAGVFGVAEGATALFAGENEELQKTLVKLQAIMTIMNGLQAIQNELKRKDSLFTTLQIAAQRAYTIAVGTSTGALKLFRIALASTGVGLIIIALGALIANFSKVKDAVFKLIPGLKAVGDFMGGLINSFTDFIGVTSEAQRSMQKFADQAEKDAKRQQEWLDANGDKYDQYTQRKVQANIDYLNKVKEINDDESKLDKDKLELIKQFREKANREISRADADRAKAADDARKQELDKDKQANDKKVQEQKRKDEEIKRQQDAANKVIQDSQDQIAKRKLDDMGKELYDLKKKYLEELAVVEKAGKDTTDLVKNYLQARADVRKKYADQDAKDAEEAKKRAEEYSKDIAAKWKEAIEFAKQQRVNEAETLNAQLITANNAAYVAEISQLNKSLEEKKISVERYYEDRKKIEDKFAENIIRLEILNTKRLLSYAAEGSKEKYELLKKLAELEMQLDNKTTDTKLSNNKKLKAAAKELVNELKGLAINLIEGTFDKQKNALEEQIAASEKTKAAEIDRINASTLSEQEKADKIKIIEAKAQADRELLERRKKQVDYQRAKFERDKAIFEIGINTATAIAKAVSASPLTGGLPFSAIAAAIGAVQIASVLARPLPKFEKGTESAPGGLAITDEKGAEMYVEPSGRTYMGSDKGPTIRYLKPGTKVIPHDQVAKYMLNAQLSHGTAGLAPTSDTTAKEIRGLKDIMYWQTNQLSNAYKKQKPNNVKVVVMSEWNTYIQKAVRD